MNQKTLFLVTAAIGIVVLLAVALVLRWLVPDWGEDVGLKVAIFNLVVDLVIGVLTIVSLYWAATEFSEFAVKPKVLLLPGKAATSSALACMVSEPPFEVLGSDCRVRVGLYLKNAHRRAARNVFLVLRARVTRRPGILLFEYRTAVPEGGQRYRGRETRDGQEGLWIPFSDDLVVYQDAVHVGRLSLTWDDKLESGIQELPRRVLIDYDVHTLDGASHGELELHIEWEES
jgi:hypothetical protein